MTTISMPLITKVTPVFIDSSVMAVYSVHQQLMRLVPQSPYYISMLFLNGNRTRWEGLVGDFPLPHFIEMQIKFRPAHGTR